MTTAPTATPGARQASTADPELEVRIETRLPEALPPGARTAVFVFGSCFHRSRPVARIELLAGGAVIPATAEGMPRRDLFRALHPTLSTSEGRTVADDPRSWDDPNLLSFRSGFWATVPVTVPAAGGIELALRATLADGTVLRAPIGTIRASAEARDGAASFPERTGGRARVAIAMATFDPDLELFRRQIESIREQTLDDWVCVISDDCTPPDKFERMVEIVGDDERFAISRRPRRAGFYRNFERALRMTPATAAYVALADQDDRWYPEKLQTLVGSLGDATLVYSDQRIVDPAGAVVAPTYWTERANNYTSLASLLVANTITGAASLFRRDLLEVALPFPDPPGTQYHDHWLGLVALCSGRIAYVDRPLYDYVQHEGAALGHVGGSGAVALRAGAAILRRGEWRALLRGSREAYFFAYCRLRLLAEVLLMRCGRAMGRRRRRLLRRFARSEGSLVGFGWLLARGLRQRVGENETAGAEDLLVRAILWRYAIRAVAVRADRPGRVVHDASLPQSVDFATPVPDDPGTQALARLIQPLALSVSTDAPERVNLLIPTIELKHFFGGYITKFNLARRLAEQGLRVRILTVDPTPPLPREWRRQIEGYAGLAGVFDRVEVAFARDRDAPVEVNPDDSFIATTWWTAHVAHAALREVRRSRFLYLIQEFEPFTFPMGSWAAIAMSTYEFPHLAMFSTELLREFFAARGYGVFAAGREAGERDSLSFQNAITAVSPPPAAELAAREVRRLLFYARPEAHGARNMFELGLLALSTAISRGILPADWELHGIGAVEGRQRIALTPASHLELLTRRDQRSYATLLGDHDVGLALMGTPHPSLVPLEMAAAGMLTVTNSFETKTPEAMSAIAGNLIAVQPSLDGIVAGLGEAVAAASDYERRVSGANVDWSDDWNESLNADMMRRVTELLASS